MKKILQFILILAVALSQVACEGDEGPEGPPGPQGLQGPQGPQGPPGVTQTAQVLDFQWTFTEEDDYSLALGFEENELEVAETDVVMVYLLAGAIPDPNDENNVIPFWSPLPQTVVLQQGTLVYNFAYSSVALLLFLQAEFDLANLPEQTDDQVFRMVIVPGELINGRKATPSVDLKDYEKVKEYYHIDDSNVRKIQVK